MGFSYTALTESEAMAERFQLLKEGEYDAVITSSKDTISANSGNNMMDMTVTVFDNDGRSHDVRDFLVFTKPMMWKVVHFANSANIFNEYQAGNLCSDIVVNKSVRVKIGIEKGKEIPMEKLNGKTSGSCYPDRNKIESYIIKNVSVTGENPKDSDIKDDDIPF